MRSLPMFVLVAILAASGCGGTGAPGAGMASRGAPDPTGGNWKTIILATAGDVQVPAPPDQGSQAFQSELNELKQLTKNRTSQDISRINHWNAGAINRWNEIARNLVAKHSTNPPRASRIYALLSVAQYDALVVAWKAKYQYKRAHPNQLGLGSPQVIPNPPDYGYPSEHAAVAAASEAILAEHFPSEVAFLQGRASEHIQSRLKAGVSFRSDIDAGKAIGEEVASLVSAYAATDNSNLVWSGSIPEGDGMWFSSANPPVPPLLPRWGEVKTWLVPDVEALRPGPPPAFGSPEFLAAVQEVRQISDTRTPQQVQIALFWADGAGTSTPPGHWNEILSGIVSQSWRNELRSARAFALLNMAMMDAGVCCWDAKYAYWLLRPSQADPAITLPVGLPNFPAYTSGHSTFSGSAARIIGFFYPSKAGEVEAMAEEAAISRLYGGIHYRFDSEVGLDQGRSIGDLAIARAQTDGAP